MVRRIMFGRLSITVLTSGCSIRRRIHSKLQGRLSRRLQFFGLDSTSLEMSSRGGLLLVVVDASGSIYAQYDIANLENKIRFLNMLGSASALISGSPFLK